MKYVRAARYGDRLRVQASLVEWETRLAINYLIVDCKDEARVGRAQTVQVAVERDDRHIAVRVAARAWWIASGVAAGDTTRNEEQSADRWW